MHLTRTDTNLSLDTVTNNEGLYGIPACTRYVHADNLCRGFCYGRAERVKLRLRWDVFNITNSVRFDLGSIGNRLDSPNNFEVYTQTLANPRVTQVALRVEF